MTVTYSSYLKLDELLALQQPRPGELEHDETLFVIIHQIYELWFKEVLHELDYLQKLLRSNDTPLAGATLKRILTILKTLVAQIDVLETITPLDFLAFRDRLESGSGFQSHQFREIEFMLGKKGRPSFERYPEGSENRKRVERRFSQPTLWDAFLQYLAANKYPVPKALLQRDFSQMYEPSPEIQRILVEVYKKNPTVAQIAERLVDLDEGFMEWRYRRVKMGQRTIGTKPGTGGSAGAGDLVTTDAEFHTIRRQLDRLAEEGIEVIKVPAMPSATLAERLAISVDDRTAAVLVSAVLYTNAHIVPNLRVVQEACERVGAELLVDAYHALNVVPFSLIAEGLQRAYVVGGGYKYCQLGPGNAFLRFPQDSDLRPVVTGWFSEFTDLSRSPAGGRVAYGPGPARFAGATYDFTSHYRAAAVFKFFEDQKLTAPKLRELNQHQIEILSGVSRNDAIGGFLAIPAPRAGKIQKALRKKKIWTDYRGEMLRLGPAPYVTEAQIGEAADTVAATIHEPRSP